MTRTIDPVASQLPGLLASLPKDTPIVMLNLLRFNDVARYPDGQQAGSGREAYARYAKVALKKLRDIGATPVFLGAAHATLIGPSDELWHDVLLVRYPSIDAFKSMIEMPDYKEATKHRTAALADARLVATTENR